MARTKQTSRKSTGGVLPRAQLNMMNAGKKNSRALLAGKGVGQSHMTIKMETSADEASSSTAAAVALPAPLEPSEPFVATLESDATDVVPTSVIPVGAQSDSGPIFWPHEVSKMTTFLGLPPIEYCRNNTARRAGTMLPTSVSVAPATGASASPKMKASPAASSRQRSKTQYSCAQCVCREQVNR